jgi:hypothetical protein
MSAQAAVQKKTVCFANVHMRPEEYAVWDLSRRLSHQSGILYFDGREIAKLFEHTSKDRIYRAARGLVKKGWFEVIAAAARDRRTGLYSCSQYRVLSAEEWAKKHPHVCVALAESSPRSETGESSRETGTGSSPQNANDQSLKRERPVPETRMTSPQNETYLDKENLEQEIEKKSSANLQEKIPTVSSTVQEKTETTLTTPSVIAANAAEANPGSYRNFQQRFKEKAGNTPKPFPKMQSRYRELVERYGEIKLLSIIEPWVRKRGGIEETRGNEWAAKNFLDDDAEDMLDALAKEKVQEDLKKQERALVSKVYALERQGDDRAYAQGVEEYEAWHRKHGSGLPYLFPSARGPLTGEELEEHNKETAAFLEKLRAMEMPHEELKEDAVDRLGGSLASAANG